MLCLIMAGSRLVRLHYLLDSDFLKLEKTLTLIMSEKYCSYNMWHLALKPINCKIAAHSILKLKQVQPVIILIRVNSSWI